MGNLEKLHLSLSLSLSLSTLGCDDVQGCAYKAKCILRVYHDKPALMNYAQYSGELLQ